ncbi:non-ribosomal peptide synthetase [Haliangium sp.]|uniref:non-ribosomal peptide synthetase n=1 Tax=Haliangium sp. TaxID=2663208 RepID=UPI003D13138A
MVQRTGDGPGQDDLSGEQAAATPAPLSEHDRDLLLRQWNATEVEFPRDKCAHELIEAHVDQDPSAEAVVWGGETLSYAELDRRANQLAHHLQSLGIGPDVLVAVSLERSVEMVVAWVAALKASGGVVNVDPGYPAERQAFMIADSRARVLVTMKELAPATPPEGTQVVCLDADADAIAAHPQDRLANRAAPSNLAYVIYTSGSTGRPKGVATSHTALIRLIVNNDYIPYQAHDRVAQVSNASFDLVLLEVWGAFLSGACLVGIPTEVVLSPFELEETLRREKISILILATALFNQIARVHPSAFRGVKHLLFGGEAVQPQWVAAVMRAGPPERLVHAYGPAENSCLTTWHLVTEIPEDGGTVPIGKPVRNTQVYLLDEARELVPVGAVGELYIGGVGLARGYLHQPELTEERFVPNPFSDQPDARMYRTGDRARWLPDGTLEFIGRADFQVKIRGFRVEPGEIEAVLAQHPGVAHGLIMVREDEPGDRRLVGYVDGMSGASLDVAELRGFLQERLPDYMVPSAIVILDEFPLNPNGKVDRGALPSPRPEDYAATADYVAPRTELEQKLAEVWAEILGVAKVGVNDDFFDLGGHSLLAVRLATRLGEVLGRRTRSTAVFQAPTIAALAEILDSDSASATAGVMPLQTSGAETPLFCVPGVLGMGIIFSDLVRLLGEGRPVYALQARGFGGDEPAPNTIEAIAADYVATVRAVRAQGPYLLIGYSLGGTIAYEMARQLREQEQEVAFLAMVDSDCRTSTAPPDTDEWHLTAAGMGLVIDGVTLERLIRIGVDELSAAELERALSGGLGPEGMTRDDLRALVPVLQGNFHAFWHYQPQPQPTRVTMFRASDVLPENPSDADMHAGWGDVAPVDVDVIPGKHHTVMREPNVNTLAERLAERLKQVSAGRA